MCLLKLRARYVSYVRGCTLLWRTSRSVATEQTSETPLPPKRRATTKPKATIKPTFEGPLPPKRYLSPYIVYCTKRLRELKNPSSLPIISKEWKEMSPQDREKYNKESEKLLEKYKKELEVFYQQFSSEEEVKEYFMRLKEYRNSMKSYKKGGIPKRPPRMSALNAMKMDRTAKLPVDKRFQYVQKEVHAEFKNLTPEQLKKYQDMADRVSQQRLEEYEKKIKAN